MRFNGHERYWDFKQENRGFRSAGFFSNLNRASSTLFVDNLPNSAEIPWFTKLFSNFGYVTEAFIPNKRSKKTGNRFGFIRFKNKGDATHAIAETDGLWVGRRKLEVCMARYDRGESFMKDNQLFTGSNRFSPSRNYHNSFAEIVSGNKQVKQSNGNVPLKEIEKRASIYLQPSASEWLWRSAIAELKDISTPEAIQNAFTELSFKDIKVRSMGGLFMIITFHTKEDRNKALSDKVVEGWFKSFKHWNGDGASHSRIIWLKCRGMPLNAWNVNSFKRISELWGKFLTLDQETLMEESFDVGRLLMVTNLGSKIDQWINVTVKGRNYKVQVWEEECNDPFFALGSKQNSNLCQSNQCKGENKVPQAKALEKMNEGGKTAFVRKSSNEMAQYRAKEKVDDLANQSTNGNNDLDNMVVDHLELAFLKNTAEINENFGATNNEVAAVMDSLSSSLGKENSAVGSEKVLDSGVGDTNSVFSPNSFVMLSDEAKTSNVMKPQQPGEESDKEAENILEETVFNHNENTDEGLNLDPIEDNHAPIQTAVKGLQGKKKRKTINEILGFSKVNTGNLKGRRSKNKCVVLRSAVAAAALSASISSNGINNRNRILLDEARTIWEINKMHGIGYDGDEEEVISKIAEMEAQNKERANGQL